MQKIEYVSVDALKVHPTNPRKVDQRQMDILCESIKGNPDFFETRPVLCNKDLVVFAGNMRLLAARSLGMKEIPTAIMDISEERQKELMIRDNRSNGYWDFDMLGNNFEMPDLLKWGFDEQELLGKAFDFDEDEKDDEVPEPPEVPVAQLGDLYQLGEHRVLCGDATKPEDVERLMAGKKANMCFTDPPYNVDYGNSMKDAVRGNDRTIMNDKMTDEEFDVFLSASMLNMLNSTDGACYVCMSSSEMGSLQDAFKKAGGHWSTFVIWAKNTFTMGRADYQRQYEPILYGWREGVKNRFWCGARDQGDVWNFDKPSKSKLHPTMKPVELMVKAITNSSEQNGIVLDLFSGSFSTMVAAHKTNRICYAMELDPRFVDVGIRRMLDLHPELPLTKNGEPVDTKQWLQ